MRRESLPPFSATPGYYGHVAHGYDLIASTYDDVEAANAVGRRLRRAMREALFDAFGPGQRVLEVGCGTGLEALALAEAGVEVVATDLSAAMVDLVRSKAKRSRVSRLEARVLAAHEVHRLTEEFGRGGFDGAYAHGGVLNMDPRLEEFARALADLVRPSGRFLCTVVNQASLFEVVFYPLVLRPRKAFRRLGRVVPIPITRSEPHRRYVVPTRFYSPGAFLEPFRDAFALRRLRGFQVILPPWNLSDYVDRLAPLARAAEAIEDRISHRFPFNAWGSVFLADLERRGA